MFSELLNSNAIAQVSVDTSQSEQLLRLLDTVVIKLEGGTDEDVAALDYKPEETTAPKVVVESAKPEATKGESTTI